MEFTPDTVVTDDILLKPVGTTHPLRAQMVTKEFNEKEITEIALNLPKSEPADVTNLMRSYIRFLITGKCNNNTASLFYLAPYILYHDDKGTIKDLISQYLKSRKGGNITTAPEEEMNKWIQAAPGENSEGMGLASTSIPSLTTNKVLITFTHVEFLSSKSYTDSDKQRKLATYWDMIPNFYSPNTSVDMKKNLLKGLDSVFLHICIMFRLKGQNKSSVKEYFKNRFASIVTAIVGLQDDDDVLFNIQPCDAAFEMFHQSIQPTVAAKVPLSAVIVMIRNATGVVYGKWITRADEIKYKAKESPDLQRLLSLFNGGFGLHLSYNGMAALYYILYIHAKCKMPIMDILNHICTDNTIDFMRILANQIALNCQKRECRAANGDVKIWNGSWSYKYARSIDPSYFANLSSRDNSAASWIAQVTYYVTNDDGILQSRLIQSNPLDEEAKSSAEAVAKKLSPIRGPQSHKLLYVGEIDDE